MNEVKDKVAVILGATSGIGAVTAQKFAAEGAKVAVAGRNKERGDEVVEAIRKAGGEAAFFAGDISEEANNARLMDEVAAHFGRIDIMVGNAGITEKTAMLHEMDTENFMSVIRTDLLGIIFATRYAVAHMLKNPGPRRGAVVNVASIMGVIGAAHSNSYPLSKAGIIHFTKSQAVSYAPHGIRMNTVSPAYVNTPMLQRVPEVHRAAGIAKHPLGRFAEPEEVADAILFLASDRASFITATNLMVDGGYTAV